MTQYPVIACNACGHKLAELYPSGIVVKHKRLTVSWSHFEPQQVNCPHCQGWQEVKRERREDHQ